MHLSPQLWLIVVLSFSNVEKSMVYIGKNIKLFVFCYV